VSLNISNFKSLSCYRAFEQPNQRVFTFLHDLEQLQGAVQYLWEDPEHSSQYNLEDEVQAISSTTDILHHSQQGERNRVCERKSKGLRFTDSQQTRFLAVVQDVRLLTCVAQSQKKRFKPG